MATILVCVDKSQLSENAFEWYLRKFHKPENKVVVLTVPEFWGNLQREMSPARIDECWRKTKADTEKLQKKYEAIFDKAEIEAEFVVEDGRDVWDVICKYAKKIEASTIVVASRGLGKIKRTILGSVSETVLHHAHVPVLIYKEEYHITEFR